MYAPRRRGGSRAWIEKHPCSLLTRVVQRCTLRGLCPVASMESCTAKLEETGEDIRVRVSKSDISGEK